MLATLGLVSAAASLLDFIANSLILSFLTPILPRPSGISKSSNRLQIF
jgi:hypothetical protein